MTSRRQRRARRRGGSEASGGTAVAPAEAPAAAPAAAPARPDPVSASTVPPFPTSMGRGVASVTSSPLTLAWTFLSLLVTWGVFVVLGQAPSPPLLASLMSLSPVHLLVDLPVAFAMGDGVAILAALAGLGVVRAVTFGVLISLIRDRLEGGPPDLGRAVRRLPAAMSGLFTMYLVEVALLYAFLSLASQLLGQLAPLAVLAALYFLAYVPVISVIDGGTLQTMFRRGFRAARLPGSRHLTLVAVYFLVFFSSAAVSPFAFATPATPSPLVWAFALVITLIHAGVLGALVYRWLAIRDVVSGEPAPRRRPS